ncbi:MAG: hypothetical protein JXR73_10605 [Candidatus Omnitrophica bacterium]|nr:hypothetical protein [Candidatus Omnitrophota bacterium]
MSDTSLLLQINDALSRELALFEQIDELSQNQMALLREENPDADAIARQMTRKAELMDQLQAVKDQNLAVKEAWEREYRQYTDEERREIKQIRNQSIQIVEQIYEREQEIAQAIKTGLAEIHQKIDNLYNARFANKAYFTHETPSPRYFDKKK